MKLSAIAFSPFARLLGVVAALLLVPGAVQAQGAADYPTKSISIIAGYPPGTATDIVARIICERLAVRLGKPCVIDNKPGQSGGIGAAIAAQAVPDGHTLLVSGTATLAINPSLYPKLAYDARRDFAAIGPATWLPYALVVNPRTGINSVQELIARARANPGKLSYASIGNGSTSHLLMSMLLQQTGMNIVHIPYKGSAQSQTDLIAGQVDLTFDTLLTVIPHVKSGRLKALATSGKARSPFAPEIPTLQEQGVAGYDAGAWLGLFAPAATPRPIIERLNRELNLILAEPDTRKRLFDQGSEPLSSSADEFTAFIATEYTRWGQRVRDSGAKIE
jgi:tripartite-type tricarboxylate transporter receptor subunit TctC